MPSTGLVPNVGEAKMAGIIVNQTSAENLKLRLYQNNVTPTSTMTLADYTEATFTGYAPITLSSSSWEVLGVDAYIARSSGSAFTCTATTSESIYGFYLTGVGSSTLLWSERFDEAPKPITFPNDAITINPGLILTRPGTARDVLTGLKASWPLTESSGTRRDIIGGFDIQPWFEDGVTSVASTSSPPGGNVARFTQNAATVTDLTVTNTSGSNIVIVSTGGGLPVYVAGDHFNLYEHSVAGDNGIFIATGTPSSSSLPCTKTTDYNTSGSPSDAAAEAAKVRRVSMLYRGNRINGFGFAAIGTFGQILLDGSLGISLTLWVRQRTGAAVGNLYFWNGSVFEAAMSLNDQNSTALTIAVAFSNVGGGATVRGDVLPGYDTWFFYACWYDPATGKASISRDAGTPLVSASAIVGGHPMIGVGYGAGTVMVGGQHGSPFYSNADMAQVNLWNKVITQTEIEYLMTRRPL